MNEKDFISVVIPSLNRPEYLEKLIISIHDFADYPFEIIVHDDSSGSDTVNKLLFDLRSKISTVVLNSHTNNHRFGLAEAADRGISLASSEYIFFINADCIIKRNIFRDVVNVLQKEYVGYIAPAELVESHSHFNADFTKFILSGGIGGGMCLAFRKSVWEEVNGFSGDIGMWSGGADIHFMNAVLSRGYFRASILDKRPIYNISLEEHNNSDTTITGDNKDCSLPPLFYFNNYEHECAERYRKIDRLKHEEQMYHRGRTNSAYWHEITSRIINFPSFDWELAKEHGFDRFMDLITKEKIYFEE